MLYHFCKSCQYCLEGLYWSCCEEKFCFDEKIATYRLEDDIKTVYTNGYANMGGSFDSVVTEQPINNNHLNINRNGARDINELPLHADKLYEIFSKSLIFRDDHELKSTKTSTETLDKYETKSDPGHDRPNRTKVYFEDEVNSPITDFEIMFKDELMGSYEMFKIDEEEESVKSVDTEDGLVMNVAVKRQDVIKPSTITIKDESKFTTITPIYKYNPGEFVHIPSTFSLPRSESLKGILRHDIQRSHSAKNLERIDSGNKLNKPFLKRVESLKAMDSVALNKVLARVPQRSASFLNVPEHLVPEKPPLVKSKSMVGVGTAKEDNEVRLGSLPDTPIIISNNLPRYFAESPSLPEYKQETSLQSIKTTTTLKMMEQGDFSMPRYYRLSHVDPTPVHESKSMPDLSNPTSSTDNKVSKRLVKLRSRLKPLVIKKTAEDRL